MVVVELKTKEAFDNALKEAGSKLVVIDFSAAWCGPCKMIGPKFVVLSDEFKDTIFLKVDVDENAETSEACEIDCMPTFIFFKNGVKLDDFSGANEAKLRDFIIKYQ